MYFAGDSRQDTGWTLVPQTTDTFSRTCETFTLTWLQNRFVSEESSFEMKVFVSSLPCTSSLVRQLLFKSRYVVFPSLPSDTTELSFLHPDGVLDTCGLFFRHRYIVCKEVRGVNFQKYARNLHMFGLGDFLRAIIQRGMSRLLVREDPKVRLQWIDYSTFDTLVTWKLHEAQPCLPSSAVWLCVLTCKLF